MFFQNKPGQRPEDSLGMDLNGQGGLAAGEPAGDEDQVPRFYQREEIFTQGAQTIAAVSKNSVFCGSIETTDDLAVFGRLEGDITGASAVRVCGEVKGQIRCESLQAAGGLIEGDIFAAGSVEISERSQTTGNIHCERAVVSGTVTGDVETAQGIILTETAVLNGDLCAAEIEMRKGARLNGAVRTNPSPAAAPSPQEDPARESGETVPQPVT